MKRILLLLTVTLLMQAAAQIAPVSSAKGAPTGPADRGTAVVLTAARAPVFRAGTIAIGHYSVPLYTVPEGSPGYGGLPPSSSIPSKLPAIRYRLTAHQAAELAVYIIPDEAILLAPRDLQEAYVPSAGADGSFEVRLESSLNPHGDWISLSIIPACQGCAYEAARSWLPWVKRKRKSLGWCGYGSCKLNNKPGVIYTRLNNKEVTAIGYNSKYGNRVNGLVMYSPNGDSLTYESAWFYSPALGHKTATAVLNFFYKYNIRTHHLLTALTSHRLGLSRDNSESTAQIPETTGADPAICSKPPYGASLSNYNGYIDAIRKRAGAPSRQAIETDFKRACLAKFGTPAQRHHELMVLAHKEAGSQQNKHKFSVYLQLASSMIQLEGTVSSLQALYQQTRHPDQPPAIHYRRVTFRQFIVDGPRFAKDMTLIRISGIYKQAGAVGLIFANQEDAAVFSYGVPSDASSIMYIPVEAGTTSRAARSTIYDCRMQGGLCTMTFRGIADMCTMTSDDGTQGSPQPCISVTDASIQ